MKPVNKNQRAALAASTTTIALFFSLILLADARAQKSAKLPPPVTTKMESAFQQVIQLRSQKKYEKAIALLNSLESKIEDHSSKDFGRLLLSRAGLWLLLGKEDGWRRDLDALASIPAHRTSALATKAYYLAIAENQSTLDECQKCLALIDKTKMTASDHYMASSAEYHLARRKHDSAARLHAAMDLNKLFDNSGTAIMVASALASCGRMKESKDWFRRVAKSEKNGAETLFTGAGILLAAGDLNAAMQLCRESIHERPGAAAPSFFLADLCTTLANQGKASEPVKPILEAIVDEKCTPTERQQKYIRLSREAYFKSELSNALRYATKANSSLSNPAAWIQIATMNNAMGRYEQATIWYEKVVAVQPRDSGTLAVLAVCYAHQDDPEKAIELCSRALSIEPNNILALKTHAAVLIVMDRAAEANADVKRLQALEPEKNHSLDTLRALGAKYSNNLIEYYRNATESWKQDDKLRLAKVEKQLASTSSEKSLVYLLQEASRLELAIGDYTKAVDHAQKSIGLGNQTYRVHAIAAAALFALNRRAEAKAEREITVSLHHAQRPANNGKTEND